MSTCLIALLPDVRLHERLLAGCTEVGVTPSVWRVGDDPDLARSERYDGVVVLGGSMSPYDASLPREQLVGVLTRSTTRGLPTLGMGAGAHLLSWALGGRPSMPDHPIPLGPRTLNRTAQGRLDPLLSRSAPEWIEWSHLALTGLPVGSEVLAVDDTGLPQAVRFGPCAWGLQGHPYLDRAAVQACLDEGVDEPDPGWRDRVVEILPRMDQLARAWDHLFSRFFCTVADRSLCH